MKKFLIKIISAVVLLLVVVFGLNKIYLPIYAGETGTKKFEMVPKTIEICNFGSSHGKYAFCYDDIEENFTCFNFALSAQSLSYDKRILEHYQDNIAEKAVVYIPISYFSFFGIAENLEENFGAKNQRYYRFLPAALITNFNTKDKWLDEYPILIAYENIAHVFLGIAKRNQDDTWVEQTADDIDLEAQVKGAYTGHIITDKIDNDGRRIINHENVNALYDMIAICDVIGARPILVTTPFLREYTEMVENESPEFLEEFMAILDKVISETGVEYYDYSHDARFIDEHDLFANGDHLNHAGAVRFTDILIEETIKNY